MRGLAVTVAAAALLVSAVPAQAAWQYYSCASDNFAAQFPDVPKMENVKFAMPRHGEAKAAHAYTAKVDNIIYKMLVADYTDRVPFGASILEEALFEHTEADDHGLRNGKILGNDTARIEPVVRGATYGRRVTMDYPDGKGRNLTTFYFRDGRLYEMSVQILPENGDYASPTGSRFVESLVFNLERMKETEGLPTNIQGCGTTLMPFK